MSPQTARELAQRFAEDAETLRARAAGPEAAADQPGPDAATSERMADACDRVSTLFDSARDAEETALTALLPVLERYQREERDPNVSAVYRGAMMRLRDLRIDS